MPGLRVGVEILAPEAAVRSAMATLPWMAPEHISLDENRSLVVLHTSFERPGEACAYAQRRMSKSAKEMGLAMEVLSTEAYPPLPPATIDLRCGPDRVERSTNPDA